MKTVVPAPSPPPSAASTLIAALHESRRRDAARVIQRYQHLVADGVEGEFSAPVSAIEASARALPAANDEGIRRLRTLGANCLMALVLLGFGTAHVIGVTVLLRTATPHESQAVILAAQGD
jgi:hypothetical protein